MEGEMPVFQAARRVAHSADDMFDLVADVERYPEFVPLCQKHAVISRDTLGDVETLITDMTIAYRIFHATFRSRVTLDRVPGRILVAAADGSLRRLHTRWSFQAYNASTCDVEFYISYELSSGRLALLIGPLLDAVFGGFVQAFEQRADLIHGRRRRAPSRPGELSDGQPGSAAGDRS
jgi:coenzyme Q-binding protein COQ10